MRALRSIPALLPLLFPLAAPSGALAQAAPAPLQLNLGGQPNDRSGTAIRTLFQQLQGGLNGMLAARGQAGGFASLDANGMLPQTQLPPITLALPNGGQLTKLSILGSGSTGDVLSLRDPWANPRSGDYGSLTVQNSAVTGQDLLAPQLPPGHHKGENIRSVLVVPPGTTTGTNSAFGFYVRNDSAADAVGVFGTTICNTNNASCWAFNPTVIDHTANGVDTSSFNKGRVLVGSELDVTVTSNDTTVSGYNCTGSSGVQPKGADCFQVGHMLAANPAKGIRWTHGLTIGDGTSQVGVLHGAYNVDGAGTGGIPDFWNFRAADGSVRAVVTQATGLGGWQITRTDGANGLAFTPAVAGGYPQIQAFGSDPNVGLVLRAQGSGPVQTASLLSAGAGLYVGTSAQFAVPLKKMVATTANLPSCTSALAGSDAFVTDASSPTSGQPLTGGGSVFRLVFCRGDAWFIY